MNEQATPKITQEIIDFMVSHSPMLRDIAVSQGAPAAVAKLLSETPIRIIHEYEELMAQVHFGEVRRANEANELPHADEVDERPYERPKAALALNYDEWYEENKHLFEND